MSLCSENTISLRGLPFAARRERLKAVTGRIGWSQLVHHTDRPAQEPVLALHARLSGGNDPRAFAHGVAATGGRA